MIELVRLLASLLPRLLLVLDVVAVVVVDVTAAGVVGVTGIPVVLEILGDCRGIGEFSGRFGVVTTGDKFCGFGMEKFDWKFVTSGGGGGKEFWRFGGSGGKIFGKFGIGGKFGGEIRRKIVGEIVMH